MKGLLFILALILLVFNDTNGCFSNRNQPVDPIHGSEPCIPDLPDPEPIIGDKKKPNPKSSMDFLLEKEVFVEEKREEKKVEKVEDNKIQLTSEIRAIFFTVEWTIKNVETLAMLGVDQLKSDHFILKNEDCSSSKNPQRQFARHVFQMICNPSLDDDRQIDYLDFKLKKLDFDEVYDADGSSWLYDKYPTFGFFNFDAEDIKYEVFSTDLNREETYVGSSTEFATPVDFGIDQRDEIIFCIHKEDIQSQANDLKVSMNLTILFEV